MLVTKRSGVWVAVCGFEERAVPKTAGYRWHDPTKGGCRANCAACAAKVWRSWWTDDVAVAARLSEYADAACKPELCGVQKLREDSLAGSRAVDAAIDVPSPDGLAYLPFQRAGIAYARARRSTLLADEMGLGKTIQALGLVNADPSVRTVLVLCPATLRINWEREAQKWLVRAPRIHVVEGRELPPAEADVVVVNYDKLIGAAGRPLLDHLKARKWDLLVADEAHYLKNPKAQRTQALLGRKSRKPEERAEGIIESASRRMFLTGTPILNKPIEIHTLLAAIAPAEFGNFFKFAQRYCDAHQVSAGYGRTVWDFSGASNLDELQERLRSTCMCRRLKADVLKELPPKRRQVVALPCDGKAKRAVDAEARAWAGREAKVAAAREAARQARERGTKQEYDAAVGALRDAVNVAFTEMAELRHDTAVAKIPSVLEHVDGLLEEGLAKVVVFVHHHDVADALAAHFGKAAVLLDGRTPMDARMPLVDRFQADPECRVFVGGMKAAGVGITLTAASTVVFAELDYVPGAVTQAEDRLHRVGQASSVLVQHLVLDSSLDARMAKILVSKQAVIDTALDKPGDADDPITPLENAQ